MDFNYDAPCHNFSKKACINNSCGRRETCRALKNEIKFMKKEKEMWLTYERQTRLNVFD